MQRGFKAKLDDVIDTGQAVSVEISIAGNDGYDFSCFGLDSNDKLWDELAFIFFNNPNSPSNEIEMAQSDGSAVFTVDLRKLPSDIQKLAFTVNIGEESRGVMSEIRSFSTKINQNGSTAFQLDLTGRDFQRQKAIIAVEIYNRNGWRVSAIGTGFNGGLADLLTHYGYDPDNPPPNRWPKGGGGTGTAGYQSPSPGGSGGADTGLPTERGGKPAGPQIPIGDDDYFEPKEGDWV
jgi:stress response protein SCP2